MDSIGSLHDFEQIKLLADTRRMEILRLLLGAPTTLTQLAGRLKRSPAWVSHHVRALQTAGLIELSEVRTTGKVTEKYYRARAGAFLLQKLILPRTNKPTVVIAGSHDLGLEETAKRLARHVLLLSLPVGSLNGLAQLRMGLCQACGAHLLDESGEYNAPYVRRLFPDREMELVTLAYRTQGLMLAPGNPKKLKRLADLQRAGVRFVNRNGGSGTRLWLDEALTKAGISPASVHGYAHAVSTHTEAAALIEAGRADAALGLQAAAHQHGLDFVALFEERYDLVLPREQEPALARLLDYVQTADFRRSFDSLTGYNTAHSGEQIPI